MSQTLSSQACGKCVLLGEHSILHGGSALSLPLKKIQLRIEFTPSNSNSLILNESESFPNAGNLFWELLKKDFSDIACSGHYILKSEIPLGAGLGSSAALSVALHRLHRPQLTRGELIDRAWKSENYFHGKSSGMDPCTIATEKALSFKSPTQFDVLDDVLLKDPRYVFVLADSGVRRSAQSGISIAEKLRDENPQLWNRVLSGLQALVLEGKNYFENSQAELLAEILNKAHALLSEWGLSHPELEKKRKLLLDHGALGAKLTGAGRGGFLISIWERRSWDFYLGAHARQNSTRGFLELGF